MAGGGESKAFKAFVDASAGAMGALFSGVLLYPLDVAKTRQQVDVKDEKNKQPASQAVAKTDHKRQGSMWMICWMIYRTDGLQGLFAGLSSKVVHTIFANFAYFYWYSFLKQAVERHSQKTITTGMNLLVASLAGALNMSMTLPLEVINTRAQTQSTDDEDDSNDDPKATKQPASQHQKKKSIWELSQEIYAEDGLLSFWKGYIPSLVLVSNPAINYTAFDKLKLRLQQSKMVASSSKRLSSLTMWEAFVLGAIAKAIATIMTYPVIRAKVLMQAQKKNQEQASTSKTPSHRHRQTADMGDSMVQVLKRIGELEGPTGYFKGCSAQLFNTVLKSALLLMTKEQITKYTMRILYSLRRASASPGSALPAAQA
ncbi:TPA: hypothetical protein N0F65_007983 [Lagenidium giganteum]|uniref:Uncharacterized protein n=1 Tax=Lagenidium giganteum TaxID=4803 RepID=A0AAV2YJ61_9STRA|nr:TPA: hypothetical protein N0F65_007983 [Lagenidium giganteum]